MNETKWISISQDKIAPASHPTDAEWALESPSIYDIPSHIRSLYDYATGSLRIEFKYLEQEKTAPVDLSEYLRAHVGKRSKRIWDIEFNIHAYSRDQKRISKTAEESINKINIAPAENREITSRAISLNSDNLFSIKNLIEASQ